MPRSGPLPCTTLASDGVAPLDVPYDPRTTGSWVLPAYFVGDDLARGTQVRVLPDHEPEPLGTHAIYLSRQHQPLPLTLFIDFLADRFGGDTAPWDQPAPGLALKPRRGSRSSGRAAG